MIICFLVIAEPLINHFLENMINQRFYLWVITDVIRVKIYEIIYEVRPIATKILFDYCL